MEHSDIEKFVQKCVSTVQTQLKDETKRLIMVFDFSDWNRDESHSATTELNYRLHNLGYTLFLNKRIGHTEEWEVSLRHRPKS